jgi:hypothetical protein
MTEPSERRRVFISYTGVEPILQISRALEKRGLAPFSSYDLPAGPPHLEALSGALAHADQALFVISGRRQALNASVELGIALAAGLPVSIIASAEAELPDVAANLPVARAALEDVPAVEAALDALGEIPVDPGPRPPGRSKVLGPRAEELLTSWSKVTARSAGDDDPADRRSLGALAERILAEAFRELEIQAIREPVRNSAEADFVVWDADLEPFVGTPLLVEMVSGRWSARSLDLKLRQLGEYLGQLPSARWALLVLALDGSGPTSAERPALDSHRILTISLPELLERMGAESFADIVRTLRNERIHS